MSHKAMKLALEALEFIPESGSMLGTQAETKRLQAITALREALAEQPAQHQDTADKCKLETVPAKGGLLPAQQEPDDSDDLTIAYMAGVQRGKELAQQPSTEDSSAVEQPAPVAKPHEQEPVAFEEWLAKQHGDPEEIGFLQALRISYIAGQDSITSPPAQRKPLTDEQREEIAKGWRGRNWTVGDIIDATEAAHGIKGDA